MHRGMYIEGLSIGVYFMCSIQIEDKSYCYILQMAALRISTRSVHMYRSTLIHSLIRLSAPCTALQILRDALANCSGNVERARDALREMGLQEVVKNQVWQR